MEEVRLDEGKHTSGDAHITVWPWSSSRSSHSRGNPIAEKAGERHDRAVSSGNLGNVGSNVREPAVASTDTLEPLGEYGRLTI